MPSSLPSTPPPRWTIGELARRAGVSAQTLRHYGRLGLLAPATTAAGYRTYSEHDHVRLDLIRALRALDVDLPTIGRVLRGAVSVRQAAELHLRALDLQARAIERRRAILRVLLRDAAPTAERLRHLHALAALERRERAHFVAAQLDARLGAMASHALGHTLREVAAVDLPDGATAEQIEAWLELAELVADPTFLARHRTAAPGGEIPSPLPPAAEADTWLRAMSALYGPAADAARAGVAPDDVAARPIVRRWVRAMTRRSDGRTAPGAKPGTDLRTSAAQLLGAIERGRDAREERFWQLVGVLRPEVARSPVAVGRPWLLAALRAWAAER